MGGRREFVSMSRSCTYALFSKVLDARIGNGWWSGRACWSNHIADARYYKTVLAASRQKYQLECSDPEDLEVKIISVWFSVGNEPIEPVKFRKRRR